MAFHEIGFSAYTISFRNQIFAVLFSADHAQLACLLVVNGVMVLERDRSAFCSLKYLLQITGITVIRHCSLGFYPHKIMNPFIAV